MGGRIAFLANCRHGGRLRAAAGFYGSGIAPESSVDRFGRTPPINEADAMQAPLFLGYGANDSGIPPTEHANIARRLSELKKTYELKVYGGAGHAFLCDERPQMYSAAAAAVAWQDIIAFFERYLTV
jgi:carboxymethylenebutenolidase